MEKDAITSKTKKVNPADRFYQSLADSLLKAFKKEWKLRAERMRKAGVSDNVIFIQLMGELEKGTGSIPKDMRFRFRRDAMV